MFKNKSDIKPQLSFGCGSTDKTHCSPGCSFKDAISLHGCESCCPPPRCLPVRTKSQADTAWQQPQSRNAAAFSLWSKMVNIANKNHKSPSHSNPTLRTYWQILTYQTTMLEKKKNSSQISNVGSWKTVELFNCLQKFYEVVSLSLVIPKRRRKKSCENISL